MTGQEEDIRNTAPVDADAFLAQVRELTLELHPGRQNAARISMDSALDRDLGLDSLARAELLLRLERRFGAGLPEQVLAAAETPRDRQVTDEGIERQFATNVLGYFRLTRALTPALHTATAARVVAPVEDLAPATPASAWLSCAPCAGIACC